MIGKIVLIAVLATSVTAAISPLVSLEPCSQLDQLKPDPKNCSRFYECTLSGWVGLPCSPGLEFNPDNSECDYPENVKCPNAKVTKDELEPCDEVGKLVPDPRNCSTFYECTLAGWVGLFCYPGLYFNPATSRCDYSENVDCKNNAPAKQSSVPIDPSSSTAAPLEPCTVVDKLKPDPKNCSRFYECTEAGWWVGLPCNVGLLFNPDTLECDYPGNVKCATAIQDEEVKEAICSPQNFDELFPDPSNCARFLQCSALGLVSMPCPSGLLFNKETLLCDYRWKVTC